MALNQFCGNPDCYKHTQSSGGRFIYSREARKFYCEDCFNIPAVLSPGKNLYDFVTRNLNGQPIHVTSLAHLRQLEKLHGASSHIANYEEKNWSTPPPMKKGPALPRQLAEMIRER